MSDDLKSLFSGMQDKLADMQKKASETVITAKSGGGLVSISVNGNFEITDLSIDDSLLEDKESMQILVIGAMNDALKSLQENQKTQALSMLGGLSGLNGLKF